MLKIVLVIMMFYFKNLIYGINKDCILKIYKNYLNDLQGNKKIKSNIREELEKINLTTHKIFINIIKKFNYFNKNNQELISNCVNNNNLAKLNCEKNHGKNNCEEVNSVYYSNKCPEGYTRKDINLCVSNCNEKQKSTKENCESLKPYFIDETKYKNYLKCKEFNEICEQQDNYYKAICANDYKNINSFCVPFCHTELLKEKNFDFKNKNNKNCIYNIKIKTKLYNNIE